MRRDATPEVVGFEAPIATTLHPTQERSSHGARFGWLILPRLDPNLAVSVPLEQVQLGAVVALPSWWRSALLQICTRFVPNHSMGYVLDDATWGHGPCRVELIKLPGSSIDVSRRLGMDVLTTPYMEEWPTVPTIVAGLIGEPSHLLIKGERLWRNTVVTLGGQKADSIEVLPDMVGITATFNCVNKPVQGNYDPVHSGPDTSQHNDNEVQSRSSKSNGPKGKSSKNDTLATGNQVEQVFATAAVDAGRDDAPKQSPPSDDVYYVPLTVWTSEGQTSPRNVQVLVPKGKGNEKGACPDERSNGSLPGAATAPARSLAAGVTSSSTELSGDQAAR